MAEIQRRKKAVPFMSTRGDRIFYKLNNLVMLFLIGITVYPMLYVVFCSFSDPDQYALKMGKMLLAPAGFSLQGYKTVLQLSSVWQGYRNTIFYVLVGTCFSMAITIMGAYVLSHKDFLLKRPVMGLIVFTMYFSGGMVPTYLAVNSMGITNTIWGFILPGAVSVYNLIVLRTSFNSVPKGLYESATIDGAGDMTMLFRIVLPLSTASLATITLFYIVSFWSSWYNALVYLQKRRDLYPLQMILRELLIMDQSEGFVDSLNNKTASQYLLKEIVKYCTIVVSTVPILIVYPFIQKYFVKGVMLGALKE